MVVIGQGSVIVVLFSDNKGGDEKSDEKGGGGRGWVQYLIVRSFCSRSLASLGLGNKE
jgi:hypothetical protein